MRYGGGKIGAALIAVVVGAAGSVRWMLRAGHPPLFLLILFTGWVLPPGSRPAFVFLVVPLGSWLLLAIAAAIAEARPSGARRGSPQAPTARALACTWRPRGGIMKAQ